MKKDNEEGYYWQCSDNVPPNVIRGLTKNCGRDDCRVSARVGETTLMGNSDYYDYTGQHIIEDPNKFTVNLCCCVCWKYCKVNNKGELIGELKTGKNEK